MNGGKANTAEAKIHTIGKLVSIISGLIILVAIILLVYRPEIQSLNIINDDSFQNLPQGYKVLHTILFRRPGLFSLTLGGVAMLGLIGGIGFTLRKKLGKAHPGDHHMDYKLYRVLLSDKFLDYYF